MPGDLLFLIDLLLFMSNITGGSLTSSRSVSITLVCALSRDVLRSTFVAFIRSQKQVFHLFFISSSLDLISSFVPLHKFVCGLKPPCGEPTSSYPFLICSSLIFSSILFMQLSFRINFLFYIFYGLHSGVVGLLVF